MKISVDESSQHFMEWLRGAPLTVEEYTEIKDTITKEWRWYLIGKFCVREKQQRKNDESVYELLTRLGQGFGCAEPTMRRFVSYFKAIDYLQSIVPDAVADILSGQLKLSVENVRNLAKRPSAEILHTLERIKLGKEKVCEIFPERLRSEKKELLDTWQENTIKTTVKDTPKYDPDAQVTGLTYTIPSWVSAIDRVFMSDNIHNISKDARHSLGKELENLKNVLEALLELIREAKE